MDDVTYASLQSVFQLSVAVNLTFAVLLALFSTALQREKDIVTSLKNGLLMRRNREQSRSELIDQYLKKSEDLDYKVENRSRRLADVFYYYFQPAFLVMAILSLVFLFVSSLKSPALVDVITFIFAFLCMAPFVVFALLALWMSYSVSIQVRRLLRTVDNL